MTEPEVLQHRRQQLLEAIAQAVNDIRQIDREIATLELEVKA